MQVAMVSQEPTLYARSIRRNIIYGLEPEDECTVGEASCTPMHSDALEVSGPVVGMLGHVLACKHKKAVKQAQCCMHTMRVV